METVFIDRESAYPNRYLVTPDNGSAYYALLTRADEPVTPGTPLNAATFNKLIEEIEALVATLTVPSFTAADYGKVLSCSAEGLKWVTGSAGLYNAEEVSF